MSIKSITITIEGQDITFKAESARATYDDLRKIFGVFRAEEAEAWSSGGVEQHVQQAIWDEAARNA